ncbi:hypothetical protein JTB14_011037 [Gonioctena quinquepunctata]|nr:hypothetical protein JTB14_011037 [Gonioctena quinquepunctata]
MKAFVLCLLAHQIFGQELPCSKSLTIDLSDSMHVEGGYLKDDVIYREGDYFISDGTIFGCLCKSRPCIRKCCAQNEMMVNNTCVNSGGTFNVTFYEGTNVSVESKLRDFHILHGVNCSSDDQYRFPIYLEESSVMLQTNGSLFVVSFGVQYGVEDYCIDVFNDDRLALVCEFEETNATDALAYGKLFSLHLSKIDLPTYPLDTLNILKRRLNP